MNGPPICQPAQRCSDYEFQLRRRITTGGKLGWRDDPSRAMANCCRNRIGSRIAEAPSGVGAPRFRNYFSPQRMGAVAMIAISILCALLICLFRLDLDDAASQG